MKAKSCWVRRVVIMSDMNAAPLWQPPSLRVVNAEADRLTFEEELENARQRGYSEGLRQGQEEGRQQARNLLAEMSALWDAMQQPFADMEHEVHSQLTGLAIAIAESILRRELATDTDMIRQSFDTALAALGASEGLVEVSLNPKDADLVASLLDDNYLEGRIHPDPNIMPGGCRLRRGHALVDATIEQQLGKVVAEIADQARLTDSGGNETGRALDPDDIQAIAQRFTRAASGEASHDD